MYGRLFVVVSGPPASGKSTIAPELADRLRLPLLAKDVIKDALMDVLPVPDVATSRQIGRAAVRAMLAVASSSPVGAVLESNFYRSVARDDLSQLPGRVVEVFCRCDEATAAARYAARAGSRHAGHFDHVRDVSELWNDEVSEPVDGGWPLIEVDTCRPVETARLYRGDTVGVGSAPVFLGIAELVKSFIAKVRRVRSIRRSRAECFDRSDVTN